MPYILTSHARHRQTPSSKHDQKTRHVGLAHVAQPSYLAYSYFGEVLHEAKIRCCVRCWSLSGLPSSSESSGHAGRVTLPWDPRFRPNSLGGADGDGTPSLPFLSRGMRDPTMRSQQVAALPWFRACGGREVPSAVLRFILSYFWFLSFSILRLETCFMPLLAYGPNRRAASETARSGH